MIRSRSERRSRLRESDSDAVWWKDASTLEPSMGWLIEQAGGDSLAFLVRGRTFPGVGEPLFISVRGANNFHPGRVQRVQRVHGDVHVVAVRVERPVDDQRGGA